VVAGVDPLIGFLSGVGVSLMGALIANILARSRDRRRLVDERRFEIYMKLMELYST
jgi:elongation factor P--beta-lysine ligase